MIHLACQLGNLAGVKTVLYWKRDAQQIHETELSDGRLPIHVACEHGHMKVVEFLIGHYESLPSRSTSPSTQQRSIVHAINRINQWTPLHYACQSGHFQLVQFLIEQHGANVFKPSREPYHFTPLHCAAKSGHLDVVRYLVEKAGASIDNDSEPNNLHYQSTSPFSRRTPLDLACQNGHLEVVLLLLRSGSKVSAQTLHLGADHSSKILRPLIKSLSLDVGDGKASAQLLTSCHNHHTLLDYDWVRHLDMLSITNFDRISQDHRYWRTWNLLALLCHRLYFHHPPSHNVRIPPLYQLSSQVHAKVKVKRRKKKTTASTLQSLPSSSSEDSIVDREYDTPSSDSLSADSVPADNERTGEGSGASTSLSAASLMEENDLNYDYEEVEEIVEFESTQAKDFCWILHAVTSLPCAPPDVVGFLARLFPAQLRVKRRALTPLLLACRHHRNHEATLLTLLEIDPRGAAIRENTVLGRLPLTHALLHEQSSRFITQLIRAYPPALVELDNTLPGWNALQVAALNADLDSLFWLFRGSPAYCQDIRRMLARCENDLTHENRS